MCFLIKIVIKNIYGTITFKRFDKLSVTFIDVSAFCRKIIIPNFQKLQLSAPCQSGPAEDHVFKTLFIFYSNVFPVVLE